MAYELHRHGLVQPFAVASAVLPNTAVRLIGTNVPLVAPVTLSTQEPFGYVRATGLPGEQVAVFEMQNVVKAIAAGSLGVGAKVTTVNASGQVGPAALAVGDVEHGTALTAAKAAGELFSLYVRPLRKVA